MHGRGPARGRGPSPIELSDLLSREDWFLAKHKQDWIAFARGFFVAVLHWRDLPNDSVLGEAMDASL